jgi:two-component system, cell cycle sensor histidine kinase and response regulator CckA
MSETAAANASLKTDLQHPFAGNTAQPVLPSRVHRTRKMGTKWSFRKPANEAPQEPLLVSYAGFQLLFEGNPCPMWIYDGNTHRFLSVNGAAVRNYLYTRAEFAEMTIGQIHSSEDLPRVGTMDRETSVKGPTKSIWHHQRKDGTIFDAEMVIQAMMFGDRQAYLVLALDVTARERAQEALRETEDRYLDLLEHASDIVFTTDLNGKFTSFNKAGEIATGFSAEEILTKNISELLGPRELELARSMRERKLVQGGQTTYELSISGKDGRAVTLAVQTSLTRREGKPTGVRGIARDITQHKQLEDRLRQSQKMEALGRLAGGIAHDFNNLLGVIVGFAELLASRLGQDSPLHNFATETLKAGQQAAALTKQLLAFSRQQVLQPKVLDLNESISSMGMLLRRVIPENINITFKPAAQLDRIKVDPGQVEQVVLNLAVNARDAMPQGGELILETSNVAVSANQSSRQASIPSGSYVLFSVRDTGVGIDEQTQARLFEPFFTTKEIGKGTGLGLATVYGIVKQSGGYISVESQVGKGTTFRIYLPQVKDSRVDIDLKPQSTGVLTGTETVLLVEDAEPLRRLVKLLLESHGYTVLEAKSSPDAAQISANHNASIDLLLTDIVMPEIDGYQLSDHMKFLRPDMKVLYMSGYAVSASSQAAKLAPGDVVISKPFESRALLQIVRQVLGTESRSLVGCER